MPFRRLRIRFSQFAAVSYALVFASLVGCFTPSVNGSRQSISASVQARSGGHLADEMPADKLLLPPGIAEGQLVTEDQAALLALWNNPAFQELLVDVKLTKADLVQAGLIPNPEAAFFFPNTDKPFKYAIELPLEVFWLRPVRLRTAEQENARTCERLTQAALDLIRDTRQAFVDVHLTRERVRITEDAVNLRKRISDLADKRLKAGDISEQEAATARIDLLISQQEVTRLNYEVKVAEERLRNLTGLAGVRTNLVLEKPSMAMGPVDVESLVQEASQTRPDAIAAIYAVNAASERVRFNRRNWFRFGLVLDATSGQRTGHEFGPALRFTLPIFNQNQGAIARAEAECERAERNRATVTNQINLDVRQAENRFMQAWSELEILTTKVQPEVQTAITRAEKSYKEGNVTYLIVLETTRQLIDTQVREAQLRADLRRFWVELERSVGKRLVKLN